MDKLVCLNHNLLKNLPTCKLINFNLIASYFPQNCSVLIREEGEAAFLSFVEMVFNSTILCIDDDVDDLAFIQEAVRSYERAFDVMEAKDGEEAIAFLNEAKANGHLPRLIIMDINMPKMDGKKAVQLIKADKELSTIPLVVFTTSSNLLDKRYFESYNVQYITKPYQYLAFTKKVAEILSQIATI